MNEDYNTTRRKFASLIGTLSLPVLVGCTTDDNQDEEVDTTDNSESTATEDTSEEVVFERVSDERASTTFPAERGDEIVVNVDNREGFRTHVVVRSTELADGIGTLLSEGVEDEGTFRVLIEEDASYTIEMTPHDETQSTFGRVKAVLIPGEGSEQMATEVEEESEEPEKEPEESVHDWIMEHKEEIGGAMQTFESGNSDYEAGEYASAEELYESAEGRFEGLLDEMIQKGMQWDRESDYRYAYSSAAHCFSQMSETAKFRKLAATNIVQHNNEEAATERWEESIQLLEDAEECRERVRKELNIDPLSPSS